MTDFTTNEQSLIRRKLQMQNVFILFRVDRLTDAYYVERVFTSKMNAEFFAKYQKITDYQIIKYTVY